jgi:glycosyltransferase involved in cell wall biosynthesis
MQSPRTVVLISNIAWAVWKFRSRLIETLRAEGYKVVVLAQRDAAFEKLVPLCDEVIEVSMAPRQISPWRDLQTLLSYRKHLRRLRPLAVLTFSIKPNIYASLVCGELGLPVVNNVTGLGAVKRKGGLVAKIVQVLYRKAFSRSACVFFQNAEDMGEMLSQALVSPLQAELLPGSGVDTHHFAPMAARPAGPEVRFCMVARLLKEKGVVEFAEAARAVKELHPNARFDLWGILDASDPRCVTRKEIADWESSGWLRFHGEAKDSREAFAAADVAVLPSYYPEGTPRTLLEAGGMALPCITTDMPGCRDAVLHDVTGLICAPRDTLALAAAMERAIELGPAGRADMGMRGRARILAEFDEDIVLAAYRRKLQSISAAAA